ncbi:MAG: hypothetical protein H6737_09290 [Alphaproteobacteria bacterium]|nr:hypothetical protein [Alphaproteobacteria bacterium]
MTDQPKSFTERGLWFPLGIAVGLGLMVLWNIFFVYQAIATAPDVDPGYTHAKER